MAAATLPEKCTCGNASFRQEGDRFQCKACGTWNKGGKPAKTDRSEDK